MRTSEKQLSLSRGAIGRQFVDSTTSRKFCQRIIKLWTLAGILAGLASATAGEVASKIIIAHRGASGYLPEHTLPGKALAHAMGADYLEQDLVLSKDGIPVVLHDIVIDTVTDVAKRFPERKRADGRYYALDFTVTEFCFSCQPCRSGGTREGR